MGVLNMTSEEIKNLISQMTLEEKASLCSGSTDWLTQPIERLGIPSMRMADGPHGVNRHSGLTNESGGAITNPTVCFPAECTSAASFDRNVLRKIGETMGNIAQAEGVNMLLGPGVNIKRSPLCGRNFEYLSEDPLVSGELGAAYVAGVQSQGVGACVKHYLANNQETLRLTGSSEVSDRALREIYMPAFETIIKKACPWSVMASYNKINGTYATEHRTFLTDILRKEWGFDGFVVSDWGATHNRVAAVAAGTDLTMPAEKETDHEIIAAVREGKLPEFLVDIACENLLGIVFRAVENQRTSVHKDLDVAHTVARESVEQSAVLLKNEDSILPLKSTSKIAFIGMFAKTPRYQGGGSSSVNADRTTNAFDAAKDIAEVTYCHGYDGENPDVNLLEEAAEVAREADVAVLFLGLPQHMESEGTDRKHISLPASHNALVDAVTSVQKNTVIVLHNGSPVMMPWVNQVKGILELYLGGQAVGEATVNLLFGKANPSGRLPETFPKRLEDTSAFLSYLDAGSKAYYQEGIYVGYRYYETKKVDMLYPFGYGLSYTDFSYSNLTLDKTELSPEDTLLVSVDVTNIGSVTGKEVIQLYVAVKDCEVLRPAKELRGFDKIELEQGQTKKVFFELSKRAFSYWNEEAKQFHMPNAIYEIQIGKSAHKVILSQEIKVVGESLEMEQSFSLMTPIGDFVKHPVGKVFMDQYTDAICEGIIRSGIAGSVTGTQMDVLQVRNMITGIYSQPISVLKMFLPNLHVNDWTKIINKLNER
jgi:beta-glucosidase